MNALRAIHEIQKLRTGCAVRKYLLTYRILKLFTEIQSTVVCACTYMLLHIFCDDQRRLKYGQSNMSKPPTRQPADFDDAAA